MIIQAVRLQVTGGEQPLPARRLGARLRDALAARLDDACAAGLSVSPGVYLAGAGETAATTPTEGQHLDSGPIETYRDLVAPYERTRRHSTSTATTDQQASWYHCYVHTGFEDCGCMPLEEACFEGLRLGGCADGPTVTAATTEAIDIDAIDYSWLEAAESHHLEFLSPYVISSTAPGVEDRRLRPWLRAPEDLRRRATAVGFDDAVYALLTLADGQVGSYDGTSPVAMAKMGLIGLGLHSEWGFGRVRIWPGDSTPKMPAHGRSVAGGDA